VTEAVPIATTDYGGSGPDVLLLHGGGRTRQDWDAFAPPLRASGYHPVAMDLRGHGDSGAGAWSWPSVLADVESVAKGLSAPAVIGHSLGGMVAALWARDHPECPLAVNVDGHGNPTRPDQYLGLDEVARAHAYLDMSAFFAQAAEGLTGPVVQMMREVDALDLMAVYRAARCPLLVISGGDHEWAQQMLPEHLVPAWEAYRAWTAAQLAAVARERPNVSVGSLPTGHDAHREDPEGLLRIVLAHLGTGTGSAASKQA
jgi:pimeloyl-ACP methyl ester carboxylesterase